MKQLKSADWSHPGESRYIGPIDKAIMSYTDIPLPVRERLVRRATAKPKQYDEIATIDRHGIRGAANSYVNLRQMFFGPNYRAEKVTMEAWPFDQVERALVFTEEDCTILIPLVCGNVARVDKVALQAPLSRDQVAMPYTAPTFKVNAVPEPSSAALIVPGLLALLLMRRRALRRG